MDVAAQCPEEAFLGKDAVFVDGEAQKVDLALEEEALLLVEGGGVVPEAAEDAFQVAEVFFKVLFLDQAGLGVDVPLLPEYHAIVQVAYKAGELQGKQDRRSSVAESLRNLVSQTWLR